MTSAWAGSTSERASIGLDNIQIEGDLQKRILRNFDRLESPRYQPIENTGCLPDPSYTWPGDMEGRTILSLAMLQQAVDREAKYLQQTMDLLPDESTESKPETEIINWAKGHYDSIHGRISSDWKWENGAFTWMVAIPPNTTGTVYMPENAASLNESGKPIEKAKGVEFLCAEKGRAVYELQSGHYRFKTKQRGREPHINTE